MSASSQSVALRVAEVRFRYGSHVALRGVSFEVGSGEVFAFLGPNGSGKTTLFRLLSTLIPLQEGRVEILGCDIRSQLQRVRESIGVVFQAPSLDIKLTVRENIHHQGALYGMSGKLLRGRCREVLAELGLEDRADHRVETLSGGLKRRVELAKGLLHHPRLLLMDEPSTGLDPGARSDLWRFLQTLRQEQGITVLLTTHLLEEADRADRIAILDAGKLVALDSPHALRAALGGDCLTIETAEPEALAAEMQARFSLAARVVDGSLRLETSNGPAQIQELTAAFGERIRSLRLGKPTLEDVFIEKTGRRFWQTAEVQDE